MQILISYNHMWSLQENDDKKPRADINLIFFCIDSRVKPTRSDMEFSWLPVSPRWKESQMFSWELICLLQYNNPYLKQY